MANTAPDKSTTGRSRQPNVPAWMKLGMRAAGAISTPAAAKMAGGLFFTPPRTLAPRMDEMAILDRAERFTVRVRGAAVRCYSWGAGPTVMLVHGWAGHAGQMTAFVEPLLAAGYRAVAVDLPGHGASGGRRSSIVHFAEAVLRVAALFRPLYGVVTHSFGAAGVTYALSRGLATDRVIFVAPPSRFEPFWERFRAALGLSDSLWGRVVQDAEAWLDVRFSEIAPLALAPKMQVPLLVVHDADDREVALEDGAALAAAWPGAALKTTARLGHSRILRDPRTLQDVVGFLSGAPR